MKTTGRHALCFLVAILLLTTTCTRDPRSVADRQLAIRVKTTFGISLPCSLAWCARYLDGGSVGGVFVGAERDTLKWSWDGAMREMPDVPGSIRHDPNRLNAWADSVVEAVPRLAYFGASHFRAPGARPLTVGSSSESLFIQLLWSAIGADSVFIPPPGKRDKNPMAASVARALQRQRAGEHALQSGAQSSLQAKRFRPLPIRRLRAREVPSLPGPIARALEERECTIPQAWLYDEPGNRLYRTPHNVVSGSFRRNGQTDWAILCSRRDSTGIMVFWGGDPGTVTEIQQSADEDWTQDVDGKGNLGYSRQLGVAHPARILDHNPSFGSVPETSRHDGIEDSFIEKGSTIHYYEDGEWRELDGAD